MKRSAEKATYNYARGALRAFVKGKITINQAIGMVKSAGVRGSRLAEIFQHLQGYGDSNRYNEALNNCRQHGLLD
jgi:hypothetical protein